MVTDKNSSRRRLRTAIAAFALTALVLDGALRSEACPFCTAAMQTLSQEIAGADAVVIAKLVEPMPALPTDSQASAAAANATAKFRVEKVLRGEDKLKGAKDIQVVYFGEDPPEKKFLITGLFAITPDKLDWTTPVPLSEAAVAYVEKLPTAPPQGADRLAFFQDYLEHDDPLLAQDSYDEFARAPYADVVALGPRMARDKVLAWIADPNVGPSGRRLYLTMLGICGRPEDVGMLEQLLHFDYQVMKPGVAAALAAAQASPWTASFGLVDEVVHAEERRKKESLDALIACYLKLKGPDGLDLINAKFFRNPQVEYRHLHSAIMALRFHGEETDVLPRERILESMRLALDHKEFADQVIPDLTRWEDWESMPRLVTMFKESDKDDWIRQPVVSYLLVAAEQPGDAGTRSKAAIAELEALDPDAVERARSLQAFSFLARSAAPAAAAATDAAGSAAATTPAVAAGADNAAAASSAAAAAPTAAAAQPAAAAPATPAAPAPAIPANRPDAPPLSAPSTLKLVGFPLLAATVLLAIFAVLLRGTDPRSSSETR
jgi:hypothetical protein